MKNLLLSITAFCFLINAQSQITINLNPDKDNSIYSENTNSNGTGNLYSGETCSGNSRRALLHFDIAGNIPSGATITAVTLTLNCIENGSSSVNEAYNLHPVTSEWGEGTSFGTGVGGPAVFPDANWQNAMVGTPWTTTGGDFTASVATTNLTAALGNYDWSSPGMITNVQDWLTTPSSNDGWILIGDESATCTARRFGSEESGIDPVLTITYECTTAPTATCQNVVAYVGSNGLYTMDPAELDGGSIATCGGALSFSSTETIFDCADIGTGTQGLVLTAIYDANLTGGLPKGVEVFALSDIPDLSIYGIGSANNGGGTDGQEFTFPAVSVLAGTYIYVASETPQFTSFFGFAPDYVTSAVNINGDDAIELFENGVVIDVFGDIGLSGTGQPWEYMDGWAYRNSDTGPDGSTFVLANWTMSGINALDIAITNSMGPFPVPIGTYTTSSFIPVTLTVTDVFSNTATCNATVLVFDTLGPNIACIPPTTFDLDGTGNLTLGVVDIDNGTTDGCGMQSMMISQTAFNCTNLGLNPITLTATDIYGNVSTCIADVTIQTVGGLTITEDAVTDLNCNGDGNGSIDVTISGGTPAYVIDWDNDGTGDNDDSEDLTNLGGGTYTLIVTDQSGCTSQLIVVVNEPAQLDLIADVTNVSCVGENDGIIDLSVLGGTSGYTYDWDNDGFGDNDDTEDLINVSFGAYNIIITDANGCSAGILAEVLDATPVDISVTQTGFSLLANATGATYQWINCPSNINVSGATNAAFDATVDGDYAVIVTDGNGCSDTSLCYTIFGLSTGEVTVPEISIYPNPANDFVQINLSELLSTSTITITDLNGRIVTTVIATSQLEKIDLTHLESGLYFVTISSGDYLITSKLNVIR